MLAADDAAGGEAATAHASAALARDAEALEREAMEQERRRAVDESLKLVEEHLQEYLQRNPSGTYTGWIADLHPENVNVDPRLLHDSNPWLTVWEKTGTRRALRGRAVGPGLLGLELERPPSGWGGLIDITLGIVFAIVTVAAAIVFEVARGLLLGLARVCELGARLSDCVPWTCSSLSTKEERMALAGLILPISILLLLHLIIWVVAVIVLVVGAAALELLAVVFALACGLLALSPTQALWTHSVCRDVGMATQAAIRSSLVRAQVLRWDQEARTRLAGGRSRHSRRLVLAVALCDGRPRCPTVQTGAVARWRRRAERGSDAAAAAPSDAGAAVAGPLQEAARLSEQSGAGEASEEAAA
ncbi:unnamed protein product [Prorocentrum cordatum]|uniref:Uncharacterized protein n=1 Tax=Prorocentrum cordatum TaxID=2364126 RepID=A0ABN9SSD0_9DINO|nr:unnamed protein product [Polarella glacialis]